MSKDKNEPLLVQTPSIDPQAALTALIRMSADFGSRSFYCAVSQTDFIFHLESLAKSPDFSHPEKKCFFSIAKLARVNVMASVQSTPSPETAQKLETKSAKVGEIIQVCMLISAGLLYMRLTYVLGLTTMIPSIFWVTSVLSMLGLHLMWRKTPRVKHMCISWRRCISPPFLPFDPSSTLYITPGSHHATHTAYS